MSGTDLIVYEWPRIVERRCIDEHEDAERTEEVADLIVDDVDDLLRAREELLRGA